MVARPAELAVRQRRLGGRDHAPVGADHGDPADRGVDREVAVEPVGQRRRERFDVLGGRLQQLDHLLRGRQPDRGAPVAEVERVDLLGELLGARREQLGLVVEDPADGLADLDQGDHRDREQRHDEERRGELGAQRPARERHHAGREPAEPGPAGPRHAVLVTFHQLLLPVCHRGCPQCARLGRGSPPG